MLNKSDHGKIVNLMMSNKSLPSLLTNIQDSLLKPLLKSLSKTLNNADNVLYQLASKSTTNKEQGHYFDAMRTLRLKREHIEKRFTHSLINTFHKLPQNDLHHHDVDELSIIDNDDLEEIVAVECMVKNTCETNKALLTQLTARINSIIDDIQITDNNNPIGPQVLCNYFVNACSALSISIECKLVLYKLFDNYVLHDIAVCYDDINNYLIEKDVLPDLTDKSDDKHQHAATQKNNDLFGLFQQLITPNNIDATLDSTSNNTIPASTLLNCLSAIQKNSSLSSLNEYQGEFNAEQFKQSLQQSLTQANNGAISRVDEDTINLISMLFEFILDDHNIAIPMKELIGRLQIPLVKVAILDKEFFSSANHPARRLLNKVATAAIGWDETVNLYKDPLYVKINKIVKKIHNDFTDNIKLFDKQLKDFDKFLNKEQQRNELIEQRMRTAEEGKLRANNAKENSINLINELLDNAGFVIPDIVITTLKSAWQPVLYLSELRDGQDSKVWRNYKQAAQNLIWSSRPIDNAVERSEILQSISKTLKVIYAGFKETSYNPKQATLFFNELKKIHLGQYKHKNTHILSEEKRQQLQSKPHLTDNQKNTIANTDTADTTGTTGTTDHHTSNIIEDCYSKQVDKLCTGAWFEVTDHHQGQFRCKLAAKLTDADRYIFVNRYGMKVSEKTRKGLAVEFRRGSFVMLDNSLLFDRAMESVIGNLRETHEHSEQCAT